MIETIFSLNKFLRPYSTYFAKDDGRWNNILVIVLTANLYRSIRIQVGLVHKTFCWYLDVNLARHWTILGKFKFLLVSKYIFQREHYFGIGVDTQ